MKTVTILYPGDLGSAVASLLVERGLKVVSCVDGRSERTRAGAEAAGVSLAPTLGEAVEGSDLVVSLVLQSKVLETAEAFVATAGTWTHPPMYLDGNSVSPATMLQVSEIVGRAGAECIDGAFLGSAKMLGETTILYLSGRKAEAVESIIGNAFRVKTIGPEIGLASAFKLAFSGFNKGLVSLFLEMVTVADRIGQREELLRCLWWFYPGPMKIVERLLPTYPRHVRRRIQEMSELVHWLTGIEHLSAMASGTKIVFEKFAQLALEPDKHWELHDLLDVCCGRNLLSKKPGNR